MNQITEDNVGLYKVAYEEKIQETADSDLTWDQRKHLANEYARDVSPSVAKAMGMVMAGRQTANQTTQLPMDANAVVLINGLLRWKTSKKWQYAKEKYEAVPAKPQKANENTVNGKEIKLPHGYISEWYELWFRYNDKLYARDKELASALGCTPSAFTFARNKMKEMGYELECSNGVISIVTRPVPEGRQKEIDGLQKYLAHLGNEVAQAKAQLDELAA